MRRCALVIAVFAATPWTADERQRARHRRGAGAGERERDLWYESQGLPVRVRLEGRDGSGVVDALR
jgi:hypothetical protein